jgi:rubredoxin
LFGINGEAHLKLSAETSIAMLKEESMDRWVCQVCGYVYDPAKGDPDSGVAAGTKFEDLPADWSCPICGAQKSDFEKE